MTKVSPRMGPLSKFDLKVEIKRNSTVDMIAHSMYENVINRKQKNYDVGNSRTLRSKKISNTELDAPSSCVQKCAENSINEQSISLRNKGLKKSSSNRKCTPNSSKMLESLITSPHSMPSSNTKTKATVSIYPTCWLKVKKHDVNKPVFESGILDPIKEPFSIRRCAYDTTKQ